MSEETMIINPKNEKKQNEYKPATSDRKNEKEVSNSKNNNTKYVAGAAGAVGIITGGAATAATMLHNANEESVMDESNENQETSSSPNKHQEHHHHRLEDAKNESENIQINPQDTIPEGNDYNNNVNVGNHGPEVGPHTTQTNNGSSDVRILGVYERTDENGVHQEVALMTDGKDVAAVLDADGDGEVDILAVDDNHNGSFEENEIINISGEHITMDRYEQAYVAQQQGGSSQDVILARDEHDYTNHHGADPISENPASEEDVQILGVYERDVDGVHQELVVLTDGEDVAAVMDVNGSGEADVLVSDVNHNQEIEENEVLDISDQHIQMSSFEEAYVEQQSETEQMEIEMEQASFDYNAPEEVDLNNDAELYDA